MLRDLSEFLVLNDDEENDDDYTAPFAAKTLQHLSEYVPVRMVSEGGNQQQHQQKHQQRVRTSYGSGTSTYTSPSF